MEARNKLPDLVLNSKIVVLKLNLNGLIRELEDTSKEYESLVKLSASKQFERNELIRKNAENEFIQKTLMREKYNLDKLHAELGCSLYKKKLEVDKCRILLNHKVEEFKDKRKYIEESYKNSLLFELEKIIKLNKTLKVEYLKQIKIFEKCQTDYTELHLKLQNNFNNKIIEFCTVVKRAKKC